jgi:murein L,D-transpeptidase YcbB/YkuD
MVTAALLCCAVVPARAEQPHFDATQARIAIELLADAGSHGLDPLDYSVPVLRAAFERIGADPRLDTALATAMQRYLHDLHDGRVPPASPARFDAEATLRAALALQDLPLAVRQSAPALPQYERLREAPAAYRRLESHPAWSSPEPALHTDAGEARLGVRLAALGDLNAADNDALVVAVRRFQQRHGLEADGVVGRQTLAALQVMPRQRVRQLELALERLRWTPLLAAPRVVVINIPEFVLRAYEVRGDRINVKLAMKVIVGRSLDSRTPLIHEPMRRIEFKPHWNVPASIARAELVPRLRRDRAHWDREGFEFVDQQGQPDAVLDDIKLDAVLAGRLRIRQRPGPRNALGDIKFVFPNRESIYLHHTPSVQLFEHARRDFSHGCIRVEQPVALARFVLEGQAGWTEEHIREAMASGQPASVALARPLPVLIAYGTALVKDSRVHFFDDLYGQDRALDAALRRREPAAPAP